MGRLATTVLVILGILRIPSYSIYQLRDLYPFAERSSIHQSADCGGF